MKHYKLGLLDTHPALGDGEGEVRLFVHQLVLQLWDPGGGGAGAGAGHAGVLVHGAGTDQGRLQSVVKKCEQIVMS